MRALFAIISLLALSVSCSGGKSAKTSFKIEMSYQGLNSAGGLVIFGKEIGGKNGRFARIVSSPTITMDIPRGLWSIGGIAWDGTSGNMSGNIVCGITTAELQGDEAQVSLDLQNATCFTPTISSESGFGAVPNKTASTLSPNFCESDVAALSGTCDYDKLNYLLPNKRGFIGSFRLSIPGGASFDDTIAKSEILESLCFNPATGLESPGGAISLTTVNVPAFISGLGIPLHIDAYLGDACQSNKGFLRLSFDDANSARLYEYGSTSKKLYGKAPISKICSVSDQKNAVGFASGAGNALYPYVICTPGQLNYLAKNYDILFAGKSYILGRDLDLSSLSGAGANPADDCLDKGDTFVPLGMNFTPVTCVLNDDVNPFTGTFDGNGNTIKNFRFKDSSANTMGFIDELDGTVSNLRFVKASIEGANGTGIAVGNMSSIGQIYDIRVTNSDVRGEVDTGAIVGTSASSADLQFFKAYNVRVEGRDQVGGLVGFSANPIKDAYFHGTVTSNYGSSSIGGIVGKALGPVSRAVSSGVLRGNATKMGGIAGDGTSCQFCRSNMFILDQSTGVPTQRLIGGIIGNGTSANSSLFLGKIQTNCTSTVCEIGGLLGTNTGTQVDSYSVQNVSGANGLNGTITTFPALYLNNAIYTGLCTTAGAGCKWVYTSSDIPRIVNVDDNEKCASTLNNGVFASQGTAGSQSDPHIICNVTQLSAISSAPGKYFSLEQSINLTPLTADTVGNFSGHLNGNNNVLFSHTLNNAVTKGLFFTISAASSVKNLELAGFKYFSSSCPSCNISPLVQTNSGLVSKVRVTDFKLDSTDVTAKLGGIAANNSGTITDSFASGDITGPKNVGGIVALNSGTVTRNLSELNYTSTGTVSDVGGIVGINSLIVGQNTFKGRINLASVSTGTRVGGIVGYHYRNAQPATAIDNHSSGDAFIQTAAVVTFTGGIVGASSDPSNVIERNVNNSLLYEPTDIPSVNAIVGSLPASYTETDLNFAIATTYGVAALSTAASSTIPSDPLCAISVLTGTAFAGSFGAFRIMNQTYFGPISGATNTWTLTITAKPTKCTSSQFAGLSAGSIAVYKAYATPDPITVNFKGEDFDLVDMSINADRERAIKAFISIQEGNYPSDAPVWILEEEGLKLFSQID